MASDNHACASPAPPTPIVPEAFEPHLSVVPAQTPRLTCAHQTSLALLRRDLHDQAGTSLAAILTQLDLARRIVRADGDRAAAILELAWTESTTLLARVRELASDDCSAPVFRALDLASSLRDMVDRMNTAMAERMVVGLRLRGDLESPPPAASAAAFWIIREALTNVFRHAHATRAWVSVEVTPARLHLLVEDDGHGALESIPTLGAGLTNMVTRASEFGGTCSSGPGREGGFRVVVELSLPPPADTRQDERDGHFEHDDHQEEVDG